ncbi:uncharacterized membrane protein YcaP (DUF421 family) [Duganella sp. 1411]|jgi:uncharacterized membrane protein YcaP (DUF421 family)|uniref:DUF421 domain-containing protein n=1 Tax=Duganella sp. 1411 TaxID=2806572 RepID=UPI001AE27186|nr:YetF domain-containing protein [Duganella sp. 1411]MBP1203133.1 uncharacterized membrane protein YcaP (DUF421 family) [Duganella sp. 1411]
MFDMELPWWEFVLRASIVYVALLIMMRFSGKRTVGQFTPFDLLVVMLLSEAVSSSLSGGDDSIPGALILALTLIVLNVAIAVATSRSEKIAAMVDGEAVLLGRDGKVFQDAMRRNHVAKGDVDQALREANCSQDKMKCIFLEANGQITVLHDE